MKYSHIIWDWNGTIIDDARLCVDLVNELLDEFNLERVTIAYYLNNFSFPVKSYYASLGLPIDSKNYKALSEKFSELQVTEGCKELLSILPKKFNKTKCSFSWKSKRSE